MWQVDGDDDDGVVATNYVTDPWPWSEVYWKACSYPELCIRQIAKSRWWFPE